MHESPLRIVVVAQKTRFRNGALVLVSILVSLGVSEIMVRLFVPVRNIGPAFSTYDPIYGKRLKKRFSTRRISTEFTMRLTTNSLGFRGPELPSVPHSTIVFIGDSFTMGYGVNDGEEFTFLVGKALKEKYGKNKVSILNAGMGDNGNGWGVKFLRDEAIRFNPCFVFLQLAYNDFNNNIREGLFDLTYSGELRELPVPRPSPLRVVQRGLEAVPGLSNSYLVGFARQVLSKMKARALNRPRKNTSAGINRKERLTYRLLEASLNLCHGKGWPVVVITVGIEGRRLLEVERILKAHNVPIIKAPSKRERPALYYRKDAHWNDKGHAHMARLILNHLRSANLIGAKKG
jgi:hypothetical protein